MERTTLGDIARAADVPVGNVYYYFKTKDQLVEAALGAHRAPVGGSSPASSNRAARPGDRGSKR